MGTTDPEPQRSVEEADLTWNTHRKIRKFFGYADDPEILAAWLDWFYHALNQDQRITLRNRHLVELNPEDFPKPPFPKE